MSDERVLLKGNVALAKAAIEAGCRFYFGYPITPQNDIPEYLAAHLPKVGGTFLQAESEIASINMCLGAAAAGFRAMTSSSGPGLSLKQEGISYIACDELPVVIINVMRSAPGLGGISPSQADYFQATRGGGQGDYRTLVLAPASAQEMWDLTFLAFDLAEKYRNPVLILTDAVIGQMMEPVRMVAPPKMDLPEKDYILNGCRGREPRNINSLFLGEGELEAHCWKLAAKYERMKQEEVRFEHHQTMDAEIAIIAFGAASRIAKSAISIARGEGIKAGLLRPITLFPYPEKQISELAKKVKSLLVVELNTGQMIEDVKLSANGSCPIHFYGRPPGSGSLPSPTDVLEQIRKALESS